MMPPAEYQWLKDELREIKSSLGNLERSEAGRAATCLACGGEISELKAVVFGNGKEGLKIKVDRLERTTATVGQIAFRSAVVVGWLVTTGCLVYTTFAR
jgi:hypothetical protein